LGKQEIMGFIGESGSGKSTLANALMGLIPYPGFISNGYINYDNRIISEFNELRVFSLDDFSDWIVFKFDAADIAR